MRRSSRHVNRLVFIETSDTSVQAHLDGLAGYIAAHGADVILVADDSGRLADVAARNDVRGIPVRMCRDPSPLRDARALISLVRVLRAERPGLVIYGTPKAALLGGIASWLSRVPRRVHVLHGLRAETMTGMSRGLFLRLDRLVERVSTANLAVGRELASEAVRIGSMRRRPLVLASGSAQGVDLSRFHPRQRTGPMGEGALRIGFIGRITPDKGIDALCGAYRKFKAAGANVQLHLVGTIEAQDGLTPETLNTLFHDPEVILHGQLDDVADVVRTFNVLCLPTRREGLPTVLIEAAAAGVPIVASRATGVTDVVDDDSAWLFPVDDCDALFVALDSALSRADEADDKARRARQIVLERFERRHVWEAWRKFIFADGPPISDAAENCSGSSS